MRDRRALKSYLLLLAAVVIVVVVLGAYTRFALNETSSGSTTTTTTAAQQTNSTVSSSRSSVSSSNSTPPYATQYLRERLRVVDWIASRYNSTFQLIRGANVGSCGYQPNAFSILDENFLAGHALEEFNSTLSSRIIHSVGVYLEQVGYRGNDRRKVLLGHPISFPPAQTTTVTIAGSPPDSCTSPTKFWIVTEVPGSPSTNYALNMNSIVPALLEKYREGDVSTAQNLFNSTLGWWSGRGFMTQGAKVDGHFLTRDLCYFLFAQRATMFPVGPVLLERVQTQLWSLQLPQFTGGLATSYAFDGTPVSAAGGHTSNEVNGLGLLAYDPRIETLWWSIGKTTLRSTGSTSSSIPAAVTLDSAFPYSVLALLSLLVGHTVRSLCSSIEEAGRGKGRSRSVGLRSRAILLPTILANGLSLIPSGQSGGLPDRGLILLVMEVHWRAACCPGKK